MSEQFLALPPVCTEGALLVLWRPATPGEEVFLTLYSVAGRHVEVSVAESNTMDFLVSEPSFKEFARLVATLELFHRAVRASNTLHVSSGHLDSIEFGKSVHRKEALPSDLYGNRKFSELLKRTAQISCSDAAPPPALARAVLASSKLCYMCGVPLTKSGKYDAATIEHLWPRALGGDSIVENLIPACADCNRKRAHSITWAWGPVQSTYYKQQAGKNPPTDLRLSLGMARLMSEASGTLRRTGRLLTFKEAALQLGSLFPANTIGGDQHSVYFELLDEVRASA